MDILYSQKGSKPLQLTMNIPNTKLLLVLQTKVPFNSVIDLTRSRSLIHSHLAIVCWGQIISIS